MEFVFALLVIGAVFYQLMRLGCGRRMIHGLHAAAAGGGAAVEGTDPVCGMTVEAGSGELAEHGGKVYRFCSRDCRRRFAAHPEMYG